jgi:very-short-patch-repair endonuclease
MTFSLLEQIKISGLPTPAEEVRFSKIRRWKFDFAYVTPKIAIEVEGGTYSGGRHVRHAGYEGDCRKYNAAALAGWRVFRFTTDMVNNGEALAVVEEALTIYG